MGHLAEADGTAELLQAGEERYVGRYELMTDLGTNGNL